MSRGLRNNNPGNIRISKTKYLGEKSPSTDRSFKQFCDPSWGYRAMFVLLHTYRTKHLLTTLRQIINRYAPPIENDTSAYLSSVAKRAGVDADSSIDTLDAVTMIKIVAAMSRVENGIDAIINNVEHGWELFVKHKP